ncbi:hypothetical protein EDD22DRAFT_1008131 [Suillus occidentalis]|nr:hypothetical protein EDD22DRAFT_1008131 [Suillus occidentalis]
MSRFFELVLSLLPSPSPSSQSHRPIDLTPSPPRLAVNGVSTDAPKSFTPPLRSSSPNALSTGTKIHKRDLAPSIYPPPMPPSFGRLRDTVTDSPIPLSPDPFGSFFVESSVWLILTSMLVTLDIRKARDEKGVEIEPVVKFENAVFRTPSPFVYGIRPRSEEALTALAQNQAPIDLEADARLERETKEEEVSIKETCNKLRVQIHEIPPDGHCLFSAVADQLAILNILPPN